MLHSTWGHISIEPANSSTKHGKRTATFLFTVSVVFRVQQHCVAPIWWNISNWRSNKRWFNYDRVGTLFNRTTDFWNNWWFTTNTCILNRSIANDRWSIRSPAVWKHFDSNEFAHESFFPRIRMGVVFFTFWIYILDYWTVRWLHRIRRADQRFSARQAPMKHHSIELIIKYWMFLPRHLQVKSNAPIILFLSNIIPIERRISMISLDVITPNVSNWSLKLTVIRFSSLGHFSSLFVVI